MPSTQLLRQQHADLARLAKRLAALVDRPLPPPAFELFDLRRTFGKQLLDHLMAEDWVLYPTLLKSRDAAVRTAAQAFIDEMGGLLEAYRAWANTWTGPAIDADWRGFAAATRDLLGALVARIDRENAELYPLAERDRMRAA